MPVALVVGAHGGVGGAVCKVLHDSGYQVFGSDRRAGEGVEPVDATNRSELHDWMRDVHNRQGRVDALVNCQGSWEERAWNDTSDEQFEQSVAINLVSVFHAVTEALPLMLKGGGGRVVNIASMAGEQGAVRPCAAYAAAKAGVIGLSKSLAREVAHQKITVNVVSPGPIATPMLLNGNARDRESLNQALPIGRLVQPEEVAAAVAFLVGPSAGAVTGEVLRVNGGALI